jgi:magnesium chelatase family protein
MMLVAAMNPHRERGEHRLNELERERLKKKLSGPVVDRIDMWLEVSHIPHELLQVREGGGEKESPRVRERVVQARARQRERFGVAGKTNADMTVRDIDTHVHLTPSAEKILMVSAEKLHLSPRSYHRTIKLARTIADLADSEYIEDGHVLEALTYRPKGLFE